MHMMVTNSNDYVLICDEFGQLATYNVDDGKTIRTCLDSSNM